MRNFILKIIIMLILIVTTSSVLWMMPGNYLHKLSVLINKREILESTRSPRIILVGGSNLLRVRSRVLQQNLGINIVNFGCYVGFRIEHIFEALEGLYQPGDVVIIVQEYQSMISDDSRYDSDAEEFMLLFDPSNTVKRYVSRGQPQKLLSLFFGLMQEKVKSYLRQIVNNDTSRIFKNGFFFYPTVMNEYGDLLIEYNKIRPLDFTGIVFKKFSIDYLNYIQKRSKESGIRFGFCFCPFPESEYRKNRNIIRALHRYMIAHSSVPLINAPEDNIYPDEFFADSVYHLTDEGEKIRTARLVQQLKRFFKTNK